MIVREPAKSYHHNNHSHGLTPSSVPGTVLSLRVDYLKYSLVAELDKGYMVYHTSAVLLRNLFKNKNPNYV